MYLLIFVTLIFFVTSHSMDINQELVKKYQDLPLKRAIIKIDHGISAQKLLKVTTLLDLYGSKLSQTDKDIFLSWAHVLLPDVVPLLIKQGANNEIALAKTIARTSKRQLMK